MPAPENPKVGGCYVRVISFLLFVFTASGAVFLVLYINQPASSTTSWYPVIGVSLVCLPWFFWLLTFLYRILSRTFGFRMMCFGPFGVDEGNAPATNSRQANVDTDLNNNNTVSLAVNSNGGNGIAGGHSNTSSGILVTGNRNRHGNEDGTSEPGSPRRVHFGGIVIIGEDDGGVNENQEKPRTSTASSSSSSSSNHSNESETPLKFAMAS